MVALRTALDFIRDKVGDCRPVAGIVLGSGLGSLGEKISNPIIIPYKDIPGFPVSTAIGHKANLIFGQLGGKTVIAMQGRFHFYEGYSPAEITMGVRIMRMMGAKFYFVTNAAGGVNENFNTGDIVIIQDHINLISNPLIGPNLEEFGERFPDMTCAYDLELQDLAAKHCTELGLPVLKGVYLASSGPSYETPAEVRMFKLLGADMVGMSTIPEVIVARHCRMRVLGCSIITNISNTSNSAKILNDGQDVIKQADKAASNLTALFERIISEDLVD